MEQLLHYVWKHKIYPIRGMKTTAGEAVEVVDPGLQNHHAGPDFFNAKLKIGGVLWVGNVEVHEKASHWYSHGHHLNPAYANVILHVVGEADTDVTRYGSSEIIPQMIVDAEVLTHFDISFKIIQMHLRIKAEVKIAESVG